MSLYLDGKVDRIALSGLRELSKMPWHFVTVKIPEENSVRKIRNWIWTNLEGRFAITTTEPVDWITNYVVGFEDPSEASAFVLSLPLLVEVEYWTI